jgi:hypothetical protein
MDGIEFCVQIKKRNSETVIQSGQRGIFQLKYMYVAVSGPRSKTSGSQKLNG